MPRIFMNADKLFLNHLHPPVKRALPVIQMNLLTTFGDILQESPPMPPVDSLYSQNYVPPEVMPTQSLGM